MTKQKYKIIASVSLIVSVLLSGCVDSGVDKPNTPEEPLSPQITVPILSTTQFDDSSIYLSNWDIRGTNNFEPEEVAVAGNTVRSFVLEALDNPYLISGYWSDDNYLMAGVEDIRFYLKGDALEEFDKLVESANSSATRGEALAELSAMIFNPSNSDSAEILELCYSSWDLGSCRFSEPEIKTFEYSEDSEGNLTFDITVLAQPLYLNSSNGKPFFENRLYSYSFTMGDFKAPISKTTEIPIYSIVNIVSSLDITSTEDLF